MESNIPLIYKNCTNKEPQETSHSRTFIATSVRSERDVNECSEGIITKVFESSKSILFLFRWWWWGKFWWFCLNGCFAERELGVKIWLIETPGWKLYIAQKAPKLIEIDEQIAWEVLSGMERFVSLFRGSNQPCTIFFNRNGRGNRFPIKLQSTCISEKPHTSRLEHVYQFKFVSWKNFYIRPESKVFNRNETPIIQVPSSPCLSLWMLSINIKSKSERST